MSKISSELAHEIRKLAEDDHSSIFLKKFFTNPRKQAYFAMVERCVQLSKACDRTIKESENDQ